SLLPQPRDANGLKAGHFDLHIALPRLPPRRGRLDRMFARVYGKLGSDRRRAELDSVEPNFFVRCRVVPRDGNSRERAPERLQVSCGEVFAIALMLLTGLRQPLREFGPGRCRLALLFVAESEVQERAHLGRESVAFGELDASLGQVALRHELSRMLEEAF